MVLVGTWEQMPFFYITLCIASVYIFPLHKGKRREKAMKTRKKTPKASQKSESTRNGPQNPSPEDVYQAAKKYLQSGLSLVPIRADGSKTPAYELLPRVWSEDEHRYRRPWSPYKTTQPTLSEVRDWFDPSDPREFGLAIIGGEVSGNLEIIDCDNWHVAEQWMRLVQKRSPALINKLVLVQTPRPGLHAYFRCLECGGNQKLARIPDPEKENKKPKTIIEIKGEGGYCLAPPSPAACHPTGRFYTLLSKKDLTRIPTITPAERELLIDSARKLNCWTDPPRPAFSPKRRRSRDGEYLLPGDDFNYRADWKEILSPHGWQWLRRGGDGSDQWCRPGKKEGTSATTNFGGSDLLYVFSSNASPFDEMTAYTKFHAYTLLNHSGDHSAAARALARLGYGPGRKKSGQREAPFERYAGYVSRRKAHG
jgi:Bifunctional DNA primase/polymerase, N-terminal